MSVPERRIPDRVSARLRPEHLRTPRFLVLLGSAFSLSAVVLTLAAIFGLMSYWVSARTREVGLRMALGARGRQVLWAVISRCLRMVLVGVVAGLVLAAGTSRLLSALLFEVSSLAWEPGIEVGKMVKKGDVLGNFSFGGSSFAMVFQPGAIQEYTVMPPLTDRNDQPKDTLKANGQCAIANLAGDGH